MTILKKKIPQKIIAVFRTIISTLVLTSLFITMNNPGIVNAKTREMLNSASPLLGAFVNSKSEPDKFPIAGDREPSRVVNVISTSYSSDPWQTDSTPCYPAMNFNLCEWAEKGVVDTVATNDYPLGTKVRFRYHDSNELAFGGKIFTVRDRMNARYTGKARVDIYSAVLDGQGNVDTDASRKQARDFGVKRLKMELF